MIVFILLEILKNARTLPEDFCHIERIVIKSFESESYLILTDKNLLFILKKNY